MAVIPRGFRRVLFVAVTMATVALYCVWAARLLPPLRNEPASFLLLPVTTIAGVAAAIVHPFLDRQSSRGRRLMPMYAVYFLSLAAYGSYLWWMVPDGTPWLMLLAVTAGHLYGLPPLAIIAIVSWLLPQMFFAGRHQSSS
jgi:hypothetical protein